MLKYNFSIRIRDRLKVGKIVIAGRDQGDAERKLKQMYRKCEILSCQVNNWEIGSMAVAPSSIFSSLSKG